MNTPLLSRLAAPRLIIALVGFLTTAAVAQAADPIFVYPTSDKSFAASLDGDWSFKYIASLNPGADAGFSQPDFKVTDWKTIVVPSNWELKGFATPHYDNGLADGTGLYRRTFRVPAAWRDGRRVCLRFEGVAYGFEAWVNGKAVGASAGSAYNQHTFDITDALLTEANSDNVLAVQVSTKPFAYEFDINDDWSLGGICRDVTLFSVPNTYVQDVVTATKLAPDGTAYLSVALTTNGAATSVRGQLIGPDGQIASDFALAPQSGNHFWAAVPVAQPKLWTAETPSLYRLQLTLAANGQAPQTVEERIGLREISIKDGVLLLNGRPFKMRGVDHHDLDPIDGRAITEAEMRRDLDLMKKANINFIRTSHYPPNKRFLELCDEMGFYVMDEVAIGRGETHDNDPAYHDNIFWRVYATIARDRNRPSVIIWSIGNENPVTPLLLDAGQYAKQVDPNHPICFPVTPTVFRQNLDKMPAFVDVLDEHYPSTQELHDLPGQVNRPVIFSEYAHALGLASDRIQNQWEIMQATPQFAGGAVWHFMDQGILLTSPTPVDRSKLTQLAWLDQYRYYDTDKNNGTDGIMYADRTPQSDYWLVRKVHSPVQITEGAATVKPGAQQVALTIENRHDFRSLEGMKLVWSQKRNGAEVEKGEIPLKAASHTKETLRVPINIPADANGDVLALEVRCLDEHGLQITERSVQLELPGAQRETWLDTLPKRNTPTVTDSANEVKVEFGGGILTLSRTTGELTIKDNSGRVLVGGIYPHTGRKPTMAEVRAEPKTNLWPMSMLTKADKPDIQISQTNGTVTLSVKGAYPRPDKPAQSFVGGYQLTLTNSGAIAISYDYTPTNATGELAEAGLSVVLPPALTEFRWIGQGPYDGTPGKDKLNEFGIFHLNREDLRFQGNRRSTELALMTTGAGEGVALAATAGDISVERDGENTLLNQNAVISGLGNKGEPPETLIESGKTPHIVGSFTLVVLDAKWPAALVRWIGAPTPATDVFKPFYHSYDQ